jgi:hypothetical protein
MVRLQPVRLWRLFGVKHGKIYHKSRYNSELQLFLIIFKRLYGLRGGMNTRRASRAFNAAGLVHESRGSSLSYSLLIVELNTKRRMMIIATVRWIRRRRRRSND